MEKSKIGENAGKVWHALHGLEKITIPELARKLDLSVERTALAVGWLARENQISVWVEDGATVVAHQSEHFEFSFG